MTIYFGSKDKMVEKYLNRYSSPIAIAQKTGQAHFEHRSKGFIWVAPQGSVFKRFNFSGKMSVDWTRNNNLMGILLHEIGHLYGNAHVKKTIMDEILLAENILDPAIFAPDKFDFKEIDQQKELKHTYWNDSQFDLEAVFRSDGDGLLREYLGELIGRKVVGKIGGKLNFPKRMMPAKAPLLKITDEQGTVELELKMMKGTVATTHGSSVFRSWGVSYVQNGYSYAGYIKAKKTGRKVFMVIERNLTRKLRIKMLTSYGYIEDILQSKSFQVRKKQ